MTRFSDDDSAEAAFYRAFAKCDITAMESVWAKEEVVCIHPGASPLMTYAAVMQSWTNILLHAQLPQLQYKVLHKSISHDIAVHVVEEHIASGDDPFANAVVLATNVYIHNNGQWLLQMHHASPTALVAAKPTLQ